MTCDRFLGEKWLGPWGTILSPAQIGDKMVVNTNPCLPSLYGTTTGHFVNLSICHASSGPRTAPPSIWRNSPDSSLPIVPGGACPCQVVPSPRPPPLWAGGPPPLPGRPPAYPPLRALPPRRTEHSANRPARWQNGRRFQPLSSQGVGTHAGPFCPFVTLLRPRLAGSRPRGSNHPVSVCVR